MSDFLQTLVARELSTPWSALRPPASSAWIAPRVASIFEPAAPDAMRGSLLDGTESMHEADERGAGINEPITTRDVLPSRVAERNMITDTENSPVAVRSAAPLAGHAAVKPDLHSHPHSRKFSMEDNSINATDSIRAEQSHARVNADAHNTIIAPHENSATSSPTAVVARASVPSHPVSPITPASVPPSEEHQQAHREMRRSPIVPRAIETERYAAEFGRNEHSTLAERTINITIGRVEVRAVVAPSARVPARATAKPMSLDEYLSQRNQRGAQ